jgi:AraC-like DNA-binding protein
MSLVLLIAGAQGVFLSIALILSSNKRKKANIFLSLSLLVCAIELLNAWAISERYHSTPSAFPFWILGSYLTLPPSIWLFFHAATVEGTMRKKIVGIVFAPAIIEVVTEFTVFYLHKQTTVRIEFTRSVGWHAFTELAPIIATAAVLALCWTRFFRSRRGDNVHRREQAKQWLFLLVFTILTLLWMTEGIMGIELYTIIEIVLCAFLSSLGYVIYFQPAFFETPSRVKGRKSDDVFTNYDDNTEAARLKQLFDVEKVHLRSRLTLEEVAKELGLPERYVSYLVNNHYGTNFTSFVNGYRVREVLSKMQDPAQRHKSLLGLALESGFSSKSSFNQTFKIVTGKTPSEYLKG